jgi:hypothetical protein
MVEYRHHFLGELALSHLPSGTRNFYLVKLELSGLQVIEGEILLQACHVC